MRAQDHFLQIAQTVLPLVRPTTFSASADSTCADTCPLPFQALHPSFPGKCPDDSPDEAPLWHHSGAIPRTLPIPMPIRARSWQHPPQDLSTKPDLGCHNNSETPDTNFPQDCQSPPCPTPVENQDKRAGALVTVAPYGFPVTDGDRFRLLATNCLRDPPGVAGLGWGAGGHVGWPGHLLSQSRNSFEACSSGPFTFARWTRPDHFLEGPQKYWGRVCAAWCCCTHQPLQRWFVYGINMTLNPTLP